MKDLLQLQAGKLERVNLFLHDSVHGSISGNCKLVDNELEFNFHCYTNHCDYQDIVALTPEEYEPKIKIKVSESDH